MKYDDSEYLFLNFETDLDNEAAATHIGMYLAWAILRGMGGTHFEQPEALGQMAALKARETTGRTVLLDRCDGKLTDDDFNALGNAFTGSYYERYFVKDYERLFQADFPDSGHPTDDFCQIADTWANFDRLAPLLDKRFAQWRQARAAKAKESAAKPPDDRAASAPEAAVAKPAITTPLALEPMTPASNEELRRRGEQGDPEAWFDLAAQLLTGEGANRDVAAGVAAFRRAAELGHLESIYNMGVAYQNGDGVTKNASTALEWFTRAADGGHGFATFMLAQAYRSGKLLPTDVALSNALSMIAVLRGVSEANRFGIVAGHPYSDLVIAMKEPGSMRPLLEARRKPGVQPIPDRSVRPTAQESAPLSTSQSRPTDHDTAAEPIAFELIATGIGAIGLFALLFFAISLSGMAFRTLAFGFALVGAVGVFRTSQRLGDSKLTQIVLALMAAVPALGSFVCMRVLYRWWTIGR